MGVHPAPPTKICFPTVWGQTMSTDSSAKRVFAGGASRCSFTTSLTTLSCPDLFCVLHI